MECPVCEHRQRKFICQACVRTHLRELRAQITKAGDERQAEVERAAKLLGSGVDKERWARAEKYALEANITAVKAELVARRVANQKGKESVESKRRALAERKENLKLAREFLPAATSSHTTPAPGPFQENTIPFATKQSPPSTASRLSRLFPFPSSSANVPQSPPPPRRHKPPNPVTEAKQVLSNVADSLSTVRSALVRTLADAYELQEEGRLGPGGEEEYIWTLGRMAIPAIEDLSRTKPSVLHTTLYNALHFIRLTSFYLGVKLPFEVGWGSSSRLSPPFPSLFIPGAEGDKLETINEDGGDSGGVTPVGVGTPWIVAGRGLGGTTDGGWGKYTTPLALHLPTLVAPLKNGASLQPAPTSKPPKPPNASPAKRRPSLLSLSRVSAAARYVAGSAYSSPRSSPRPSQSHSNTVATVPTRSSIPGSRPRQRAGSVSMQIAPQIRARVASLATVPTQSTFQHDTAPEDPVVQTPIQSFVAALTMVQYNVAYLAWTQGALDVGHVESLPGVLALLGATILSEGIGFAAHNSSAAQDHALPPPTRSFSLSFPALLKYNLGLIGGSGSAGALPSQEGDAEWDLIEASEEEDGVG